MYRKYVIRFFICMFVRVKCKCTFGVGTYISRLLNGLLFCSQLFASASSWYFNFAQLSWYSNVWRGCLFLFKEILFFAHQKLPQMNHSNIIICKQFFFICESLIFLSGLVFVYRFSWKRSFCVLCWQWIYIFVSSLSLFKHKRLIVPMDQDPLIL